MHTATSLRNHAFARLRKGPLRTRPSFRTAAEDVPHAPGAFCTLRKPPGRISPPSARCGSLRGDRGDPSAAAIPACFEIAAPPSTTPPSPTPAPASSTWRSQPLYGRAMPTAPEKVPATVADLLAIRSPSASTRSSAASSCGGRCRARGMEARRRGSRSGSAGRTIAAPVGSGPAGGGS